MESIQYSLILKSKDGLTQSGAAGNSAANVVNSDLTYFPNVYQIFSRIAGIHKCNHCKLELAGVVFLAGAFNTLADGYDIIVYVNGTMNTIQSTNSQHTEQIIGAHNPTITALTTKASSGLAYTCPVYIQDLNNVTSIRIVLRDSMTGTDVGTVGGGIVPGAYSMMFRITPIFS